MVLRATYNDNKLYILLLRALYSFHFICCGISISTIPWPNDHFWEEIGLNGKSITLVSILFILSKQIFNVVSNLIIFLNIINIKISYWSYFYLSKNVQLFHRVRHIWCETVYCNRHRYHINIIYIYKTTKKCFNNYLSISTHFYTYLFW